MRKAYKRFPSAQLVEGGGSIEAITVKREIRNLTTRPDEELAELYIELARHESAEDIFRWLRRLGKHDGTEDLVVQDEFTHDGIFPAGDGLYLVYSLT